MGAVVGHATSGSPELSRCAHAPATEELDEQERKEVAASLMAHGAPWIGGARAALREFVGG